MDNYSASLGIFILSMIELCISPVSSAAVNTLKRIEMGNMEYHLTRRRVIKNTELMGIAGAMSQLTGLSQTTQTKKPDYWQPGIVSRARWNGSFNTPDYSQ